MSVKQIIDAAPDGSTVIIGYGGAVGGGKTFLEAGLAAEMALETPGAEILVGRQDYVDLKDTTLRQFDRMTLGFPNRKKYDSSPTYRELAKKANVAPGRVSFRGLEDWESIMSTQYSAIFVEEAHEVPLEAVLGLLSRLRHPAARVYVMLICFNPLGGWPEKWFMKGELPKDVSGVEGLQVHFVPARMSDNPHLRSGYEEMLRAMYPEHLVKKLIEGLPGGVEYAIYPHFVRELHIRDLPADVRFTDGAFGADYGRVHKSAAVAVSVDQCGRRWVREAWGEPSDDHGAKLVRRVGELRQAYSLRRGRVDPNQDHLAGSLGASLAKGAAGARKTRTDMTGRLMNIFPMGYVPPFHEELRNATPRTVLATGDSPGFFLVKGAPGIDALAEQLELYHWDHIITPRKDDYEVHRDNEDLVAALEYAIEELETAPAAYEKPVRSAETVYRKPRVA